MQDYFIIRIFINKVRHLENLEIFHSPTELKHLILTGKNGSGKTSVLKAIKQPRPDDSSSINLQLQLAQNKNLRTPTTVIEKNINLTGANFDKKDSISDLYFDDLRDQKVNNPVGPNADRRFNYQATSSISFLLQHLVNIRTEQAYALVDGETLTVAKIQLWIDNFEKALQDIFEEPKLVLRFDRKNFTHTLELPGRDLIGFQHLSRGFLAYFVIFSTILMHILSTSITPEEAQGVVMIDEIEAHLHISLQKQILPFLTRMFPRLQFLVTTHSPFVLNSISNAVIYDLEQKIRVEDLSGYSYDGLVESYFNLDKYSSLIKDDMARYEALAQVAAPTEDEQSEAYHLRKSLSEIPSALAPELKAKFFQIETERLTRSKR